MKSMVFQRNVMRLIRVTLSLLMIYLQLLPVDDIFAATDSSEFGEVGTPESTQIQQAVGLPFVAGDAIMLSAYPDTSSFLNGIFPIDDQGYIEFPIGERIKISNMSEEKFLNYLKSNYQNYMRSPNLFVKPMIRVTVVGGFVTPGLYYVDNKMSLWDLIRLAGGPNHEGAIKDINWERNGEKVIEDITPYLENGNSLRSIGFKSGDLVWTPSPDAQDAWDFVVTKILPVAAFTTSLYLIWISYNTMILVATRGGR